MTLYIFCGSLINMNLKKQEYAEEKYELFKEHVRNVSFIEFEKHFKKLKSQINQKWKIDLAFQNLINSSSKILYARRTNLKKVFHKDYFFDLCRLTDFLDENDYPDFEKHMRRFLFFHNLCIKLQFQEKGNYHPFEKLTSENYDIIKQTVFIFYNNQDMMKKITKSSKIDYNLYFFVTGMFEGVAFDTPVGLMQYRKMYQNLPEYLYEENMEAFAWGYGALKDDGIFEKDYILKEYTKRDYEEKIKKEKSYENIQADINSWNFLKPGEPITLDKYFDLVKSKKESVQ